MILNRFHLPRILLAGSGGLPLLLAGGARGQSPDSGTIGPNPELTAVAGWTVERVAGPPLVDRPVEMSLAPDGRLYVTEVSGTNAPVKEQLEEKPHRVLCLRDEDGDGNYDSRTVFADGLGFPEGCLWFGDSVYVAAPPVIWKFTDRDGDGVSDERSVWYDGKTLTGCANDLHGPYAGPDGWLYWGKGGFAEQTHPGTDGRERTTAASHLMRARPDGSHVEAVINGGMDNPVGVTWTADGECILSNTFLQHPGGGKRDGLIHAVENGLWGKDHNIIHGLPLTGPLMPVMTHMGAAAPCGLATLPDGDVLGCQFNMRKVSRHTLQADGASFKTVDSDFLISENPDFHPTDVLVDRDGSVLVIDTGGWYKVCCPTSQIAKPQVTGGIYRLRRAGSAGELKSPGPTAAGKVWAACRAGDAAGVRAQLLPDTEAPARAAALAAGRLRDREAVPALLDCLKAKDAGLVRAAAEALGRCGDSKALPPLLAALRVHEDDRFIQHTVTDSLRLLANDSDLSRAWKTETSNAGRTALLYAGFSRAGAWPDAAVVLSCLASGTSGNLRAAALKICQDHADWSTQGAAAMRALTTGDSPLPDGFSSLAATWMNNPATQETVAVWLGGNGTAPGAMDAIRQTRLTSLPAAFLAPLVAAVERGEGLEIIKSLEPPEREPFLEVLRKRALGDANSPPDVRALRLLDPAPLDDALFAALLNLFPSDPAGVLPGEVPAVLAASPLTDSQRRALLSRLPAAGLLALPDLVKAITQNPDESLGLELLRELDRHHLTGSLPPADLDARLSGFPESVKSALKTLRDRELSAAEARRAGLRGLADAAVNGDPAKGHLVFQGAKASCTTCHQIGYKGGTLGPDLSGIGKIRTEMDLLESITLPSSGFVRSYEPLLVKLKDGSLQYGIQRGRDSTTLSLAVASGAEIRLPLENISSTETGEFSLMPAGYGELLSQSELTDLAAFLKSLQ